jgi:hypothetical protein
VKRQEKLAGVKLYDSFDLKRKNCITVFSQTGKNSLVAEVRTAIFGEGLANGR